MGGKNKKASSNSAAATPAAAAPAIPTQPMQTVQGAMPGQLDTLAQQLGAGFGQNPADILAMLQQYHQPMTLGDFTNGYVPPPAPAPAAKTTSQPKQTRTAYTNTRS